MTAADTVDDYLDKIVENKRKQFHAAMNRGEQPIWKQVDIVKELVDEIVKKHGSSKLKKLLQY